MCIYRLLLIAYYCLLFRTESRQEDMAALFSDYNIMKESTLHLLLPLSPDLILVLCVVSVFVCVCVVLPKSIVR